MWQGQREKMEEPNINISLSRADGKHLILEACNKKWQTVWDSCHTGRHYYKVQKNKARQYNPQL